MAMKKSLLLLILSLLTAPVFSLTVAAEQADTTRTEVDEGIFIIETRHRLFPQFLQVDTVGINQVFLVGEEEWQAEVIAFNPHLGITMEGEALTMSDTLYNPAVRVRVLTEGEVKQESWGFHVIGAPHFHREDLLAFKLVEFEVSEKYVEAPAGK
jgi:hypothetical protein